MAKRIATEEYLEKAKKLTEVEAEKLVSRIGRKIGRRFNDNKLTAIEAIALQLEKEDEDLKEWRKQFAEIRSHYLKQIKAPHL